MTADLSTLPFPKGLPRVEPRIHAELVDGHNIDEWLHIQKVVWDLQPELAVRMREARQRRAFDTGHGVLEYVVRANGTAMGSAAVHLFDEFAHLSTGALLPEFRKQGLFQLLVRTGLDTLRAMGWSFVTVHAVQSTSAPIFRKLGFHWDCDFTYYVR
jgi:hypothetical protein